jgi:hypothetical protein
MAVTRAVWSAATRQPPRTSPLWAPRSSCEWLAHRRFPRSPGNMAGAMRSAGKPIAPGIPSRPVPHPAGRRGTAFVLHVWVFVLACRAAPSLTGRCRRWCAPRCVGRPVPALSLLFLVHHPCPAPSSALLTCHGFRRLAACPAAWKVAGNHGYHGYAVAVVLALFLPCVRLCGRAEHRCLDYVRCGG